MSAPDIGELLAQDAPLQSRPGRRRTVAAMLLGLALVVVVAIIVGSVLLGGQSRSLLATLENRLDLQAAGRVEVIETWAEGTERLADQLVGSDFFRLFATESGLAGENSQLAAELAQQEAYMGEVLSEFVRQNRLVAAYLIGPGGRIILRSATAPELSQAQRERGQAATALTTTFFAPVRRAETGLELDIYRPVRALQAEDPADEPPPVAALLMTVPVTTTVADFLAPRPLSDAGERTVILQAPPAEPALALLPESPADPVPLAAGAPDARSLLPFAERTAVGGTRPVFSLAAPVATLPWLVVQEIDREAALAPLAATRATVLAVAILATLVIGGGLLAVWFLQSSEHNRRLADQFRDLAGRIDAQRRLLDGITGTIREFIGLKRRDGTYAYVNPAFAEAVGRAREQLVGQTDDAIFGQGTARRLEQSDHAALERGSAPVVQEQVYLGSEPRFLEISKVAMRRDDGRVDGLISVARDVTELVEQRRRREAAVRHTIDAFIRTIELSDPYLSGHARLLHGCSALVARRLDLPPEDVATLDVASNLSQVGKLFVPREILSKPDRLTPDEIQVMQRHVEHASVVLRDIDFDLPVHRTIVEMYERLDGSGYPQGLKDGDIDRLAQILGICDVFCARIRPRSYRGAIPAEDALSILADHPERYAAPLVAALGDVMRTTEGEKLLIGAGTESTGAA